MKFSVNPELLRWACNRPGVKIDKEIKEKVKAWINKKEKPTLPQLKTFAKSTYTPIGYLFLDSPPEKRPLPIPDLRTIENREVTEPSVNLLDTIYLCQRRQDWYKDYLYSEGYAPISFVGSFKIQKYSKDTVKKAAEKMRQDFNFDEKRNQRKKEEDRLRFLKKKIEKHGIIIMSDDKVANSRKRNLDVDEFRGFALSDNFAPIIFINENDSKSAQIFTLAHELAHIGLGESGISNMPLGISFLSRRMNLETWCNAVAAEFLIPLERLKKEAVQINLIENIHKIAKDYQVSNLVVIRRLYDGGYLTKTEFEAQFKKEKNRLDLFKQEQKDKFEISESKNSFFAEKRYLSEFFTQSLIASTLEGKTPFTEAFRLLEVKGSKRFQSLGRLVGIIKKEK